MTSIPGRVVFTHPDQIIEGDDYVVNENGYLVLENYDNAMINPAQNQGFMYNDEEIDVGDNGDIEILYPDSEDELGYEPNIPPEVEDEKELEDDLEMICNNLHRSKKLEVITTIFKKPDEVKNDALTDGTIFSPIVQDYNFHDFPTFADFAGFLCSMPESHLDPSYMTRLKFCTVVDKVYVPGENFRGQLCSIDTTFNSKGLSEDERENYLNFADYAPEAFEFVSYLAAYKVDEYLSEQRIDGIYGVKMCVTFHAIFYHINSDGSADFRTEVYDRLAQNEQGQNMVIIDGGSAFKMCYNTCVELYNRCLECLNPTRDPSAQSKTEFHSIRVINITLYRYKLVAGGSFIDLPQNIKLMRAVINPKCDNGCFMYSVMLGVIKVKGCKHSNSPTAIVNMYRQQNNKLDFAGFEGYVTFNISNYERFCAQNPGIFLKVWILTGLLSCPIKLVFSPTNPPLTGQVVNLLFLYDPLSAEVDGHYACIKTINRMLAHVGADIRNGKTLCPFCNSVYSNRIDSDKCPTCHIPAIPNDEEFDEDEPVPEVFVCEKCLTKFNCKAELEYHADKCAIRNKNYRNLKLPKKREYLQLGGSGMKKLERVHTWMFADFECILPEDIHQRGQETITASHHPCSFALVVRSDYPELEWFKVYTGKTPEDTMEVFCDTILHVSQTVYNFYLRGQAPMKALSPPELIAFVKATTCYLCGEAFNELVWSKNKCRDHDHVTGWYIGAACRACNLARALKKQFITLFFHNGKNYDMHLVIKEITKKRYGCVFDGIPENAQKVMSMTIKKYFPSEDGKKGKKCMCHIRIVDSFGFLLSGLENFTEVLKQKHPDNHRASFPATFSILEKYNRYTQEQVELALQKNAYPYLWFTDFDKFDKDISELTALFDNNQYEVFTEDISEAYKQKFERMKEIYHKVISAFGFHTVKEYCELYVSMDVLQLCDGMEFIRELYRKLYKLDPFRYYGLSNYTWDAFQYHNKDNIYKPELFMEGEMNMYCFILKGIRGGCSGVNLREAIANNEFCPGYNWLEPHTHLLYFDANNLYGWAMSQKLPYGNFRWSSEEEIALINQNLVHFITGTLNSPELGRGFIAEVDLVYPQHLHDAHNNYPLAPEKRAVREEELSDFSTLLNAKVNRKHNKSCVMLLQTLEDKEHYITYYKNLAFYVQHGLILTKVHRILWFAEAEVMKSYIDTNTIMRNAATSAVEKNAWKGMNNSCFGKSMEDQTNHADLSFVSTVEEYNKAVANPGFQGAVFHQDDFMIAKILHKDITLTKPIYLGMVITELAKLHMFEFYYDVMQDYFGYENLELCMTDTDSLFLKVTLPPEKLAENRTFNIFNAISEIQRDYGCPIDTSGFPEHILRDYRIASDNNKRVGFFKSEVGANQISEFIGLRAKAYSYKVCDEDENVRHIRLKGVGRAAIRKVEHEAFRQCIHNELEPDKIQQEVDIPLIRAKLHNIYSILSRKVGLSCNDTKRFILGDNVHTLAFGHYKIPQARAEIAEQKRISDLEAYFRDLLDNS